MYLATSTGVFYTFDMTLLPVSSGAATGPAIVIKTGNPSLQLSFSCDFSVLWAQNYENNQWSTINVGELFSREGERAERERKMEAAKIKIINRGNKNSLDLDLFPASFAPTATGVSTPSFTLAIPGQAKGLRDLGGASCSCA